MTESQGDKENGSKFDVFRLIRTHGRRALIAGGIGAMAVAVVGGAYVRWGQLRLTVASLEFRPTFSGLEVLTYPNGLPFSPNDVTAGSVVDAVFDSAEIAAPCDRETFRGAFFVEQRSDESMFIDIEYQARLSEPRITSVERKLLQEEHAAKRRALPLQYRLVFVVPRECKGLPSGLISKVMVDMLKSWASESVDRRGVLRHQVEILTPSSLDVADQGTLGLLLRVDLLRTALQRVITNVTAVAQLPGASLTRFGEERVTFAELEGKLKDLMGSKLDPLVMTSGRFMAKDSLVWLNETVATAERRQKAAEQKVAAFEAALREFSGRAEATAGGRLPATGGGGPASTNTPPAVLPQLIDSTFIDRIIDMSSANARYRQSLTDLMVQAQLEAVAEEERGGYYRRLQQAPGGQYPPTDLNQLEEQFNELVKEGKRLTKQFGDLYEEFSRVSLRSTGSLYKTEKPVAIEISQRISNRSLMNLVAASFAAILLLALGFFAFRDRMMPEYR